MARISGLFLIALVLLVSSSCLAGQQVNPKVIISTIFGDIAVELFADDAPITVDNFLQYVNSGFYDELIFHRVIDGDYDMFMIQGGGYEPGLVKRTEGLVDPIINESYNGLSNLRGTIAMARTSEPNSATSQFFINHADNLFLDRENAADGFGYCVFGRVTSGMNIVDFISQIPTYTIGSMSDVPIYTDPQGGQYWVTIVEVFVGLREDFNNDGIVNFQDFTLLASAWKQPVGERLEEDLDKSGDIDWPDLRLFADGWLGWYSVLPTDLNKNGIVNFEDFALLAAKWLLPASRKEGDWDGSGSIGLGDIRILAADWLKQSPGYE